MPTFDIIKQVTPKKSFRVASVMGKFDIQNEKIIENFKGEIDLSKEWNIGVIYGHSGTGKSTIAKELFKDSYIKEFDYKAETILDDMPEKENIETITLMFNSVGFSSPPSWLKPYSVLSTGERMRVDLARALLENRELIVFDEFTSVVDRIVAKIGSYAISKSIRRSNKKFIAVSCHEDIIEWLEPDWIFNTNDMNFKYTRGLLRRPQIELEIYRVKRMWSLFRKYHYLNTNIHISAQQYVAFHEDKPIAFCGVIHFPHPKKKNFKKISRLVTIPDYQGVGCGSRLANFVAEYFIKIGFRMLIVTSTPALIHSFKNSKHWKLYNFGRQKMFDKSTTIPHMYNTSSYKRYTTSWEYIL